MRKHLFITLALAICLPGAANGLTGDMNCDGAVDFGDINPFVLALSNPVAWQALYPDCDLLNGDINGDGVVDFQDINPFVVLLTAPPEGACCFADGTCAVLTEAECGEAGGLWEGDDWDCDPNPCPPPVGACCFADGDCHVLEEPECVTAGGLYQGDFTVCEPNPCPQPTGACCFLDGTCDVHTEAQCLDADGDYQGDFTDCDPNPCAQPIGACCFLDGTCLELVSAVCEDQGGLFQGNFTVCEPNPCPQPTGACCFFDGTCDVLAEAQCLDADGDYQGDFTDCDPNPCPQPTGACCYIDGTCSVITEAECLSSGGEYRGDFTDCDPNPCPQPTGACCFADGMCLIGTAAQCALFGGDFQGPFTDCDPNPCPQPTGACCFLDGTCAVQEELDCVAAGGEYQGDFTDCSPNPCPQPTGACCFMDGTCSVEFAPDCEDLGGAYQGHFTDCDPNPCPQPTGACCFVDGTCTEEEEPDCLAAGGDYQGDFTDCSPNPCPQPLGACCFVDGTCDELTAAACAAGGGDYQGHFTDCLPNPCPEPTGACCAPDGSCTVTAEPDCTWQYQGHGTTCSPNPCEPYCVEATITLEIYTDDYPSETTWQLVDQSNGSVVATGGPYTQDFTLYVHEVCVTFVGCYDFTIYDSYGDGICCAYGDGYYNVLYEGTLVATGGEFGSQETVTDIGGCVFEGACCYADGACDDGLTEEACEFDGGVYQGNYTACATVSCPQPGACCYPDGTCTFVLEAACGGDWQGAGVTCESNPCSAFGACCQPDGTCEYITADDCDGDWQGAGTTCDPNPCPQPATGACCLPDGSCQDDLSPFACDDLSGDYQGAGTACDDVSCPQPAEPIAVELAGNPLDLYPYFEYVKAFNENRPLHVAIDPSRYPGIVGRTADLYVVDAKTLAEWQADPSLDDVTPGGALTVTFSSASIQANTFNVAGGYTLNADAGIGLGVGYDVVIDFDRDGQLGTGDYIDGYSNEAGLYLVHDTTQPGPLAVTEITYSGGSWLDQDLYYPTGIAAMGQLPLVVISHGNGHNYQWYDHIGYHMASYGYIVMSHSNNTGPGIETASTTTLTNTDYIIGNQGSIGGGVLQGHLDSHRITWIGHSRGGEGITRAYDRLFDGAYSPNYFSIDDIVLLSSMLPTDFLKTASSNPHNANYHLWTAAGDSDVSGSASCDLCQTFHLHDRATHYRQSTVVQGTGHAWFHDAGGTTWFTGPCPIYEAGTHLVQLGYFLPLIKYYVEGNVPAHDFLWRQYEHFHPIGVPVESDPCFVVTHEHRNGSDTGNFFVDDFETNTSTAISSSGGAVTFTVQNLTEGRLDDNNTSFSWTSSDPFNGATQDSSEGADNGRGVVFDWNGTNRYIEWEIIPGQRDLTDNLYLSLRGAQGTQHPYTLAFAGDVTFTVTLRDSGGTNSSINIGAYGGGLEQPYDRSGGWHNEMEIVRIRLTDFLHNGSGLDLTNVVAVRLNCGPSWGSNEGRIVIDEVMLTNDVPPPIAGALVISLPDGAPGLIPPGVPTLINVMIVATGEAYVPGSGQLHYRYGGGSYAAVSLTPLGGNLYRASLPAPDCDDTPQFYFSAAGTTSGEVTLPAAAPSEVFSADVGALTTYVYYDFETNPGWTVAGDATDGQWDRGVPVGGGDRGDPPTDYDGSGQCWLTDNVDGNSDVDAGTTTLTSNIINLSGLTDPYVSYARWYNNVAGDNPEEDTFVVEVSENGGSTWETLEAVGPSGEEVQGGWYVPAFRLLDHVSLTSQFRIRFHASDLGGGSVVEAGLDAFTIYEVACD